MHRSAHRPRRTRAAAAAALLATAATGLGGCGVLPELGPELPPEAASATPTGAPTAPSATPTPTPATSPADASLGAAPETLHRWENSVLRIRAVACDGLSTGSGFVVDAHTIVTNRHVVKGATTVQVETADGGAVTVKDIRQAKDIDLAVIHTASPLPAPLPLGKDVYVGVRVAVIGYPLGGEVATSEGVVAGWYADTQLGAGAAFETSARVEHGDSGGPVLDSLGVVRGVVYSKTQDGTSGGIGAAVLASHLKDPQGFPEPPSC